MKRVYKKSYLIILAAIIAVCCAFAAVFASSVVAHADADAASETIYWVYDEDSCELTIYGNADAYESGDFTNSGSFAGTTLFSVGQHAPWYEYREDILSVTFDDVAPFLTSYWFHTFTQDVNFDFSGLDASKIINSSSMFDNCKSLTELDLSDWNTSSLMYTSAMFNGCNSLTKLDLSGWDTSNVIAMNGMFANCLSLTEIDLSDFDTSSVMEMAYIFVGMSALESISLSDKLAASMAEKETALTVPLYIECKPFAPSDGLYKGLSGGTYTTAATAEHQIGLVAAVEPNCTEAGNIEHYACSVCKTTFEDEEGLTEIADVTIPADPTKHDWQTVERVEPTETKVGYTEHEKCSICGETQGKEEIPATGVGTGDDPTPGPGTGTGSGSGSTNSGTKKSNISNETILILLIAGVVIVTLMAILALILAVRKRRVQGRKDDDGFYEPYHGSY